MSDNVLLAEPRAPYAAGSASVVLDATGLPYRELNARLYELAQEEGLEEIVLHGVMGQRYIGTNLHKPIRIVIEGVPGNDLGAFMDGPQVEVLSDAQDGCGNTMNRGTIVIHGSAGDIVGHSMRGGRILVRGNVGYRVGIHMKEYESVRPVIVIGGTAQHFLGEYMAGGALIVLGLDLVSGEAHPSRYVGTGMHGGVIYMRGQIDTAYLGRELGQVPLTPDDEWLLKQNIQEFVKYFAADDIGGPYAELSVDRILQTPFVKLMPLTKRPYGALYAY